MAAAPIYKGERMRISITLPRELGRELRAVAAATGGPGYTGSNWAADLVASELASRRIGRIMPGRYGARVIGAEKPTEPVMHRLLLPEMESL